MKKQAISHAALWIISFALTGCALFDPPPASKVSKKAVPQRVFYSQYDKVWNSALVCLKYSIAQNNQDSGYLETDFIKSSDGWLPPEVEKKPSPGSKYKIIMNFARGKIDGREATRVSLQKKIEVQKDFFSEPEVIDSDGLEEKVIFYRMEREIIINEALKRANGNSDELGI